MLNLVAAIVCGTASIAAFAYGDVTWGSINLILAAINWMIFQKVSNP